MGRIQYERYRNHCGRKARGSHQSDHSYNSPNIHYMAPGEPYRYWFYDHIFRTHYSLEEAINSYLQPMARRPPTWAGPTVPIQPVQPFTDAITFTLTPSPPSLAHPPTPLHRTTTTTQSPRPTTINTPAPRASSKTSTLSLMIPMPF